MNGLLYIAVDLGAGSGRVFLAGLDRDELLLDEAHRFRYPPYFDGEYLRWDFRLLFDEIKTGLRLAGEKASQLGRRVASIGVDSWGVDFGLINGEGKLAADPICYRDARTDGVMEKVFAVVPQEEIYDRTGIQFQKFNTLYQLCAEGNSLEGASKLLLLPDLINYFLTGQAVSEYTNSTTTQMVNAMSGSWDYELIDRARLPRYLLQEVVSAGTKLGTLQSVIAEETGLAQVEIIAPATHDTASAVAAAPLAEGRGYISSGTWSLIGIERSEPLITRDAQRLNFTNEGGAYGTFRFLKNVMGLWIFERCRTEWESDGKTIEYETLIREAAEVDGFPGFMFPDDERFLNPPNMLEAIKMQFVETGQNMPSDPAAVTKVILDSLAFRYSSVLRSIETITGRKLTGIEILGGGGRNRYLNQLTANARGLPVRSGLTEATVVGNVLVQAVTSGRFESLAEARSYVESHVHFEEFTPSAGTDLDHAKTRYSAIEARFTNSVAQAGGDK